MATPTFSPGPLKGTLLGAILMAILAAVAPTLKAQSSFVVRNSRPGGSFLWGVAAGPHGIVAVGDAGAILTSRDGSTWTRQVSGTTVWLTAVAWGPGQYIAVGDSGTILVSGDAISWTPVAQSATTQRLNNVIYAAGQYVAVGEAGTLITSPDGLAWTARSSGVTGWLRGLAYTNEINEGTFITSLGPIPAVIPARFITAGQGGNVRTSIDGINWSEGGPYGFYAGEDIEAIVADNTSHFVALGADGALFTTELEGGGTLDFTYEDLVEEEPAYTPAVHFRGLVQGPSALVLTGENGTVLSPVSMGSGTWGHWSLAASATTANLVAETRLGDSVFIVGENETILQSVQPPDSRLVNLSCRTRVGNGADILIAGFVVGGQGVTGTQGLLIRASGPALVPFGVAGTLADPELQLFSVAPGGPAQRALNTGWDGDGAVSAEAARVGAFPWTAETSHDAALAVDLAPGPYTANVSGQSGDTGVALAEIYDATEDGTATAASPRLVNLSARCLAGTGENSLIAGFVIGGSAPKTVLIRASGPALLPFGITGVLADPQLQVYSTQAAETLVASNLGWGGDPRIAIAAAWVGAFSWGESATADSALLLTLPPGPYTANVTGAGADTGVCLVEVYEVQ